MSVCYSCGCWEEEYDDLEICFYKRNNQCFKRQVISLCSVGLVPFFQFPQWTLRVYEEKKKGKFFTASTKNYKHNSKCKLPDAIWEEQLKLLILWQKLPNFLNDQFTFFFSNGPAKEQGNLFENACKGGMRGFLLLLEVYRPPGVYMRVTGLESCAGGQM